MIPTLSNHFDVGVVKTHGILNDIDRSTALGAGTVEEKRQWHH
jgi:hypothetical protein